MTAKKLLILLLRAGGVYLLVFLSWYYIWSPVYLQVIGFTTSKFLPVILVKNYRVISYELRPKLGQSVGKRNNLRFTIQVRPQVTNWIQFGATDLTYPIVTFVTLILVSPRLSWRKRLKILALGSLILWLFYSWLALLFFRVIDYLDGRGLSHLGLVENIIGMERLIRWKQSGGIAILAGQFVPVAIWFVSIFGQFWKKSKNRPAA
ncbi:MAG: hypothetical protein A2142_04105 [candidate division Zixibacteria bacterium RBG_16_48_11]|nr:MAG: hypothetical protein A2142_04105 [candidate division Zixibacteria bacterium RBG_16_48_11]